MTLTSRSATAAEQIKVLIRRRYTHVAEGRAGFRGGMEKALAAGYPHDWLKSLPPRVAESYRGCGFLLEDIDLSGVKTVVDLGCGAGLDARLVAERMEAGGRVIALDLTPWMLTLVEASTSPRTGASTFPIVGDMECLPLKNEMAEMVMANASFNLTLDKPAAAAEAFRILRPGGRLILRELILEGALPQEISQDPMAGNTSLGGVLPARELYDLFQEAGFQNIRISDHRPFSMVIAVRLEAQKSVLA